MCACWRAGSTSSDGSALAGMLGLMRGLVDCGAPQAVDSLLPACAAETYDLCNSAVVAAGPAGRWYWNQGFHALVFLVKPSCLTYSHCCRCCSCRVLVLDQGLLLENGEPHALLQQQSGLFTGMVEQTGSSSSAYLRDVAREASYTRAATRSVPSGSAMHLHRLRQQQHSMVIGRPAPVGLVGEPVSEESEEEQQQQGGAAGGGGRMFSRNRSELGLTRYTAQVSGRRRFVHLSAAELHRALYGAAAAAAALQFVVGIHVAASCVARCC